MIGKIFKAVRRVYDWLFNEKEEETTNVHYYNNVIQFTPRTAPAPARVAPAPARVAPAPTVGAPAPARVKGDLKEEFKTWKKNVSDYDKLRQKLAN